LVWVSNLIFIRNWTLVFFLIGLIYNVLFSFLYSIPVCSEGNIVDHISAKHKLTWCCLQCCMIGASNSLITMQLIGGINQMDYRLVLLDFHYCSHFPSQMIWAGHWKLATLCTRSMIAFDCGWYVVTCSWFGFNAIVVTHLFELTFEFANTPIVKEKKLRSRVTCQLGVIKQIQDGCCWLICSFDNFKTISVDFWNYHCDWKQRRRECVWLVSLL
jgi:hypothetical protein